MRFDATGATVSAQSSWTRIALNARPPAPAADTRRTHAKARSSSAVAQALGHCLKGPAHEDQGKALSTCLPASFPADRVNHNPDTLGISFDSLR